MEDQRQDEKCIVNCNLYFAAEDLQSDCGGDLRKLANFWAFPVADGSRDAFICLKHSNCAEETVPAKSWIRRKIEQERSGVWN